MSAAEERFIAGAGPLAALIRAQPAFEAPPRMLEHILAALDAAPSATGFDAPAGLFDAVMAEAERIDSAQAPRREALLAELAAGKAADDALGAPVSPATAAWLAGQQPPSHPAPPPRRRRWPWLAGISTALTAALAVSVALRVVQEPAAPPPPMAAQKSLPAPAESRAEISADAVARGASVANDTMALASKHELAERLSPAEVAPQKTARARQSAPQEREAKRAAPQPAPPPAVMAMKTAPRPLDMEAASAASSPAPTAAVQDAPARLARAPLPASPKAEAPAQDSALPATIHIPAGPFIAGSDTAEREAAYQLDEAAYGHTTTRDQQWYAGEAARHTATTGAYAITTTPITQRQYAAFIADTGHPPPEVDPATWAAYGLIHPWQTTRRFAWANGQPPAGRDDHPVVLVSRADADAYAAWLSQRSGQHWRLPTELEWEKAARGTDGRPYPWGNTFDPTRLNSHDAGPGDTTPVGQHPTGASPWGLLDPAGQVYEWTATPASPGRAIVKGGAWDDKGCGVCRPAARHGRPVGMKHVLIGFRLVRDSATP